MRLAVVMPYYGTDFDPIRAGARLMLHGQNAYQLIGPGRPVFWNYRLLYPMPAMLIVAPFVAVPVVVARAAFVAILSGLLAFASTRQRWVAAFVFLSGSWWFAVGVAQWSPGLLAVTAMPWLGFLIAAKPNIGLAVLAAARNKKEAVIVAGLALIITVASFAVRPDWFSNWHDAIRDTPHIRPLIAEWRFGGPLLALAALHWRRPEARLLLALACLPMNPGLYEGVLLFAVPETTTQAAVLAVGSWLVDPVSQSRIVTATGFRAIGQAMLVCMYLPALGIVLRGPRHDQVVR